MKPYRTIGLAGVFVPLIGGQDIGGTGGYLLAQYQPPPRPVQEQLEVLILQDL